MFKKIHATDVCARMSGRAALVWWLRSLTGND
jgi:hypothetical protein